VEVLGRENCDLGDLSRSFEIRLEFGNPCVSRRYGLVSVAVDGTARVELIAYQTLGAEGDHLRCLVFERVWVLETAELAQLV
jgi:hypothetical protein